MDNQVIPAPGDNESQKLDEAFAFLMNYQPEQESDMPTPAPGDAETPEKPDWVSDRLDARAQSMTLDEVLEWLPLILTDGYRVSIKAALWRSILVVAESRRLAGEVAHWKEVAANEKALADAYARTTLGEQPDHVTLFRDYQQRAEKMAGEVAQLQQDLMEAQGIARGLADVLAGRTLPIEQVPLLREAENRAEAAEGEVARLREQFVRLLKIGPEFHRSSDGARMCFYCRHLWAYGSDEIQHAPDCVWSEITRLRTQGPTP